MDLNKNIFAILAVFLVLLSVCAVSAADDTGVLSTDDGNVLGVDGNTDINVTAVDDGNATGSGNTTVKVLDNATGNSTTNTTGNTTGNITGNATHNATNSTGNATSPMNTLQKLATGNPILALLAVTAVLGGYTVMRRK